ncbi:MAG: extracellular solute-binding protein, partial [Treponema sp.]|nr:extracellular solute-binding protein [Treponema sp.]
MKKMLEPTHRVDKTLFGLALLLLAGGIAIRAGIKTLQEAQASTLVFTQWWQDELKNDTLTSLIGEFEKSRPDITITVERLSYQEMEDQLLNRALDATSPSDILALDPRWLYELIRNDRLAPLDAYIEKTENMENMLFIPSLPPNNPEAPTEIWAIPVVSYMIPLFYNVAVLQAAGFDRPPKNRADFLRYAQAITDRERGRFALALALNPEYPDGLYVDVYSWIWAAGALMLPGGKPDVTSPLIRETLDFLTTLHTEGLLAPNSFSKTREEKLEDFIQGKIGMMLASVQDIDTLRQRMGEAGFGITTVPGLDNTKKPVFGLTSWYIGISRQSEHQEQAWAFLSFLAERSSILAAASYAVPGSWMGAQNYLKRDPLYAKAYDMYEGGDALQEFTGIPRVYALESIMREELYAMLEQGRDAAATAQGIQTRWEEALGGGAITAR